MWHPFKNIGKKKRLSVSPERIVGFSKFSEETYGIHSRRTLSNMLAWEKLYTSDGLTFTAINAISHSVLAPGYKLVGGDEEKAIVEEFLDAVDFEDLVSNIIHSVIIFGDAFVEKIFGVDDNLINLCLIDPKTVEIVTDERGNIKQYIQNINDDRKPILFSPTDIVQITLYKTPSSPYGTSAVGANYDNLVRKLKIDESLAMAIKRHGSPKYHVKIGSPKEEELFFFPVETEDGSSAKEPDVIESLKDQFKDFDSSNEFFSPAFVDIETLDVRGIENVGEYYQYFLSLVASGFEVPIEQLGVGSLRGSTEASSRVRDLMFLRYLRAVQNRIERVFNSEIFPLIVPSSSVRLKFKDISPEDEKQKIVWLRPFIKQVATEQEVLTIDEIREVLGFRPKN